MRKILSIILISALLLSMSACGGEQSKPEAAPVRTAEPVPVSEAGDWIGEGGCYRLELLPDDGEYATIRRINGRLIALRFQGPDALLTDEDGTVLFEGYPYSVAAGADSLWISWQKSWEENGQQRREFRLSRLAYDGAELASVVLNDMPESLAPDGLGGVCVLTGREVTAFDADCGKIAELTLDESARSLHAGGNGRVWAFVTTQQGGSLLPLDTAAGTAGAPVSVPQGLTSLTAVAEDYAFLCADGERLYSWNPDTGEARTLLVWDECGIAGGDIQDVLPDGDGFLCLSAGRMARLRPAEPSEIQPRIGLTLCESFPYSNFEGAVAAFNAQNGPYYVEIVNYGGENGDPETMITRLNTELITGKGPDMISFSVVSPGAYAAKGALVDMGSYVDAEADFSRDDFCFVNSLGSGSGMYSAAPVFTVFGTYGFADVVGSRYGWSWDEYFAMEDELPEGAVMMGFATGKSFLDSSLPGFLSTAIDWTTGECRFDSPEFIRILEAALAVYRPGEAPENMMYASEADSLFTQGKMILREQFITSPVEFALPENQFGKQISYIGWPTPDGSCGSAFMSGDEIGICSASESPDGCWEFIRFVLTGYPTVFGLPTYKPNLDKAVQSAMQPSQSGSAPAMTAGQAERFYEFIGAIDKVSTVEYTVQDIIQEEAAAMFAGDRTPAETARIIQSRASIYVAEQS